MIIKFIIKCYVLVWEDDKDKFTRVVTKHHAMQTHEEVTYNYIHS